MRGRDTPRRRQDPDWVPETLDDPDLIELVEAEPVSGLQMWKWVRWRMLALEEPKLWMLKRAQYDTFYVLHTPAGPVARYESTNGGLNERAETAWGVYRFSHASTEWSITMQTAPGRHDVARFKRAAFGSSGTVELRLGRLHRLEWMTDGFCDDVDNLQVEFIPRRNRALDVSIDDARSVLTAKQLTALCCLGLRLWLGDNPVVD
jgi:hypothetical protein